MCYARKIIVGTISRIIEIHAYIVARFDFNIL